MRTIGFLIAAAAIAGLSSGAFAAELPTNPGEFNKYAKELCGTPGQNTATIDGVPVPANVYAKLRNEARKALHKSDKDGGLEELVTVVVNPCAFESPDELD